jgi:hypothetical protein
LIEGIDFNFCKLLLHPNSLYDFSERFTFSVCDTEFECGLYGASFLSYAASKNIFIENKHSLLIECPSNFERSKFVSAFSLLFESLKGFPLEISTDNCFYFESISKFIENSELLLFCRKFITSNFTTFTSLQLLQHYPSDALPTFSTIYDEIASTFHSFDFSELCRISIFHLRFILNNDKLCLKDEDSLFKFLNIYLSSHPDDADIYSLFEFVCFERLTSGHLQTFFTTFPIAFLTSTLWNSLLHLNPNPDFSVPKDRYFKAPIKEIKFEPRTDGSNGVFSYFRSQCSNQNPQNSSFLSVTASSTGGSSYSISNVLDWNTNQSWCAIGSNGQWIEFDFKDQLFVLNSIAFLILSDKFSKKWVLLGYKSNNDDNPTELYQSNDNPNMYTNNQSRTTSLTIPNDQPFQRYRILGKDHSFGGDPSWNCGFYAIELYGTLIEKQNK